MAFINQMSKIFLLMSLSILAGCAPAPSFFTHDIPEYYRTVHIGHDKTITTEAAVSVLEEWGFSISMADTEAGILLTKPKWVKPHDPEIGGEWELIYFLKFNEITTGTLVTAEIIAQGDFFGETIPMEVNYTYSRSLYRDYFIKIKQVLEE